MSAKDVSGASFQDHFSGHASQYAEARPNYPVALFQYLSDFCETSNLAWDCATGNGQAALGLAEHFQQVIATDASAEQLREAIPHERITYRHLEAEAQFLDSQSVDLVTVAQALHWFDLERFYAQVNRVLKPGGAIAVWTYAEHRVDGGGVLDEIVADFYVNVLADYWPLGRTQVKNRYQDISFPFKRETTPEFPLQVHWNADQHWAYLMSWSATQRFLAESVVEVEAMRRREYLRQLELTLQQHWGSDDVKTISWPLTLLVGRT